MGFKRILDKYRQSSFSQRDKGDRFERLMQAYLRTDPKNAFKFKNVWLRNEFPGKLDWGVVIPELTWLDKSQVDVVQSVGRVMRRAPDKEYGYIIIPVVFARTVQKVGDRRYWEQWAKDVAQIADRQIKRITFLIENRKDDRVAFDIG